MFLNMMENICVEWFTQVFTKNFRKRRFGNYFIFLTADNCKGSLVLPKRRDIMMGLLKNDFISTFDQNCAVAYGLLFPY